MSKSTETENEGAEVREDETPVEAATEEVAEERSEEAEVEAVEVEIEAREDETVKTSDAAPEERTDEERAVEVATEPVVTVRSEPAPEERVMSPALVSKRNFDKELRIDHRNLPAAVEQRLSENDQTIGVVDRAGRGLYEARFKPEFRMNHDGTASIHGYATVYGYGYDVGGGAPFGFHETVDRGAADRSVAERSDVRLLINHDGIALARTKSGTLRLESDETGLYMEAPNLDVQRSPLAQSLMSAMERGDMDEMSFAFKVLRETWNDDYTVRNIHEVMLFDVSVVTYPANPAAVVSVMDGRSAVVPDEVDTRPVMDLAVAQWIAANLDEV